MTPTRDFPYSAIAIVPNRSIFLFMNTTQNRNQETQETPMTNSTLAKRINVTTTAYGGDVEFPEASSYPEYVAEQLAERYGAEVDVQVGGRTQAVLYGFDDETARDLEHEVTSLVKVDLWDEFCNHGYRAYSA